MKSFTLAALIAVFGSAATSTAMATARTLAIEPIMTCKDILDRTVDLNRYGSDDYATVTNKAGTIIKHVQVMFEHFDRTFPSTYTGKGIKISIDSIIPTYSAENERLAKLKLGRARAVEMKCTLPSRGGGAGFDCPTMRTINCMPPHATEGLAKLCSTEYRKWVRANCEAPPMFLD